MSKPKIYICCSNKLTDVLTSMSARFELTADIRSEHIGKDKDLRISAHPPEHMELDQQMIDSSDTVVLLVSNNDSKNQLARSSWTAGYARSAGVPIVLWIEPYDTIPDPLVQRYDLCLIYDKMDRIGPITREYGRAKLRILHETIHVAKEYQVKKRFRLFREVTLAICLIALVVGLSI